MEVTQVDFGDNFNANHDWPVRRGDISALRQTPINVLLAIAKRQHKIPTKNLFVSGSK
jgi:hypothetical protein